MVRILPEAHQRFFYCCLFVSRGCPVLFRRSFGIHLYSFGRLILENILNFSSILSFDALLGTEEPPHFPVCQVPPVHDKRVTNNCRLLKCQYSPCMLPMSHITFQSQLCLTAFCAQGTCAALILNTVKMTKFSHSTRKPIIKVTDHHVPSLQSTVQVI